MKYILAIDDDPGRYDGLLRLLDGRMSLVVASCSDCVRGLLPDAVAVLLDHDLNAEPCACGRWGDDDSRALLPDIIARRVPVIVTSASASENRAWLTRRLVEAGVPTLQLSAAEIQPELPWLGWLWTRGGAVMVRQPTDDERAALLRATWRPWLPGTTPTCGPRSRPVPAIVVPWHPAAGELLACLDGWDMGERVAEAGGIYRLAGWGRPLVEAWVGCWEGRSLRWWWAEIDNVKEG